MKMTDLIVTIWYNSILSVKIGLCRGDQFTLEIRSSQLLSLYHYNSDPMLLKFALLAFLIWDISSFAFSCFQVKLSVLKDYMKSATAIFPTMVFASLVTFIVAQVCTSIWLSKWTQQTVYNGTVDRHETDMYLGVYGALGAAQSMTLAFLFFSVSWFPWS